MKNPKLLIFGVIIIILAVAIGVVAGIWQKERSLEKFESEKVSFKYPKEYVEQEKPAPAQNQAETLIKLKVNEPLSLIEFAKEQGAIKGANITKTPFLDFLEGNAERGLPRVYKDYKKIKGERIKISGHDASIIAFSYTGQDKKTTLYLNFFIIPVGNDGYYLTIQSVDQGRLNTDTKKIQPTIKIQ